MFKKLKRTGFGKNYGNKHVPSIRESLISHPQYLTVYLEVGLNDEML